MEGSATFRNCPVLRRFTDEMQSDGIHRFHFYLEECSGMDSTFLGSMAGLRLRVGNRGAVVLHAATGRVRELIELLGLDRVVEIDTATGAEAGPLSHLPHTPADREDARDLIIQAHEDLSGITPDNRARFQNVLEFLRAGRRRDDGEESQA